MTSYDDVMKTVMENYGKKIVDNITQENPMLRNLKELADDYARRNSIFGHGHRQGGLFTPNELSSGKRLHFLKSDFYPVDEDPDLDNGIGRWPFPDKHTP